ncbi:hypothetical protein BC833DRAFT_576158 [Globomyces pollinis-pini]|nr:hypothetical protein BC833DRAFT_576158 [Globomyces pollinis-pini]
MPETKDSTIADCQYFFGSVYPLLVGAGRPRYTQRDCCRIDSRTSQCRSGCRLPSLVCVDGRLTMIELPSQGLLGTLPPTVTNLRKLQSLNLMNNQISGIIPGDIGGLSDLTTIALRTNRFNGTIPASLGKLSNLDLLYSNLLI